jgi:hypothetical protein
MLNRLMQTFVCMVLFLNCIGNLKAQSDSALLLKKRQTTLKASSLGLGISTATTLYFAWYKNYSSNQFHFFNDAPEWLQVDKLGHVYSNYQLNLLGYNACKWANYSDKKSLIYSSVAVFGYFTTIEIMDGFSSGWGFSSSDMLANASGISLFAIQQHFLKDQFIKLKFSFHQTNYPKYRQELLGNNLAEQLLKDYNGQTYWLSFNPFYFSGENFKFPKWLNLAIGFGAEGMISGRDNYVIIPTNGKVIGNTRYRKLLLSLDFDLTKIKTNSKILKNIFLVFNSIKIPVPAIEFSNKTILIHNFYY